MISLFSTYAIRENTYAVDDENINLKHPIPVAPTGTVRSPAPAPEPAAAAADKIPFVATAIVAIPEDVAAVQSINRSKVVPASAPNAAPKSVPVGSVMVTADAELFVMYPVAT